MSVKTIKDAVHDHIHLDELAVDLLDTPEMQRLRRIRQLGTAYLVYPSANHTRFEHSLGVHHLADAALDNLGVEGDDADGVRAAALLHDVGHTPYSHNVEDVVAEYTGLWHDDVDGLLDGEVGRALDRHGLDVASVGGLIEGEGRLGQLVSGVLDVDRMDYLVRDAYHTGVPYGTIDSQRLVLELDFVDDELVLGEGNVQTAEALLLARALMHPTVYSHHVARISKAMLRRATRRLVDEGDVTASEVRRMDDHELTVALREFDGSAALANRLADRRLYKRAAWLSSDVVAADVVERDPRRLEREVAEEAGVDVGDVIVDMPPETEMVESGSRVVVGGRVRRLEEESSLVDSLRMARDEQWRLGVYAPERSVADVEASIDWLSDGDDA